jgi:hypothetical protein
VVILRGSQLTVQRRFYDGRGSTLAVTAAPAASPHARGEMKLRSRAGGPAVEQRSNDRRAQARPARPGRPPARGVARAAPHEAVDTLALVAALLARKRTFLSLKVAGLSYDEIAAQLGVTYTKDSARNDRSPQADRVGGEAGAGPTSTDAAVREGARSALIRGRAAATPWLLVSMRLGTSGSAEQAAKGCCFRPGSERVVGRGTDDRSGRTPSVSASERFALASARRSDTAASSGTRRLVLVPCECYRLASGDDRVSRNAEVSAPLGAAVRGRVEAVAQAGRLSPGESSGATSPVS